MILMNDNTIIIDMFLLFTLVCRCGHNDHKSNDGLHLGWFVKLQRPHLKSGKLTDKQVERLEELGFGAKGESELEPTSDVID